MLLGGLQSQAATPSDPVFTVTAVDASKFVQSLEPGPFILPSEPGSWTWGMAPIYDEAGRVHVFNSVIPDAGTWVKDSKIVHWVADQAEGPYDVYPENPLISYADQGIDIEDPYAFAYNGQYYMILEDRQNVKGLLEGSQEGKAQPGGFRPGLIYQSADGLDWGIPKVGYLTNEIYYGHALARSERPSILWKDGQPEYLFLACHDDDSTAGYILKINDWKGE